MIFFQYFIDQFRGMNLIRNRCLARPSSSPALSYSNNLPESLVSVVKIHLSNMKSILYNNFSVLCKLKHVDGPEPEEG